MKVCIIGKRLLQFKDSQQMLDLDNYSLDSDVDTQLVNDYAINKFNELGDSIIYDNSVRSYLIPELYEIEEINKKEFKINKVLYKIIGYLNLTFYSEEDGEQEIDYYITDDENTNGEILPDCILRANSDVFKYSLMNFGQEAKDFMINEYSFVVNDLTLFNHIEKPIILMDKKINKNLEIYSVPKISNSEKSFLQEVEFINFTENGKCVFINGYEKILKPGLYFITDEELGQLDNYNIKYDYIEETNNTYIGTKSLSKKIEIKNLPRRRVDISMAANKTIDRIYIYDNLKVKAETEDDYEDITYIMTLKNASIVNKNGYYRKSKNKYFIDRNDLGDCNKYSLKVEIIDINGRIVYRPNSYNDNNVEYNDESILTICGYNAQAKTSIRERREALERCINEHGKAKTESILSWLIRRDSGSIKNREANYKREMDLKWLKDYKTDKQRKVKI